MKVLVTGGAGFIGSWVTKTLLTEGHDVTIVDNLSKGFRELVPEGARFIEGDVRDDKLPEWMRGHDAVIHLAAFIEVGRSVKEPLVFAENNIMNGVRVLEAMRQADVGKIVFASSATVYGVPQRLPIEETDPMGAQNNPYGATKVSTETFIVTYNQLYGMDAMILRFFNPFGPNELHDPETHAVPNFVRAVIDKQPIPLFWNGDQTRDYIYVEDLARAMTSVLPLSGLEYFNVGSETGAKTIDLVRAIMDIAGYEVPIKDLGERPGDVPANYASSKKLMAATDWRAQLTLREGLERTYDWFRSRA